MTIEPYFGEPCSSCWYSSSAWRVRLNYPAYPSTTFYLCDSCRASLAVFLAGHQEAT